MGKIEKNLTNGPDSRRYKRFPIMGNCRIFIDSGERALHAIIDNINVGGIGIHRREPLPMESVVRIELKFLDRKGETFLEQLKGKIVQITERNGMFLVGIAFKDIITEVTHPQLIAYLREKEKD
jgi:hypothetical protein